MNINKALLVGLVLSLALGAYLLKKGYQSNKYVPQESEADEVSEIDQEKLLSEVTLGLSNPPEDQAELKALLEACEQAHSQSLLTTNQKLEYGKLKFRTAEIPTEMMAGIKVLKEVEAEDPENIEALEILGALSVQSNQLEKAKERYQKLLSLRPGNEKYKQALETICAELGHSDCFE